jgi:glycosyltransferase involved in cell wall biosynthesis
MRKSSIKRIYLEHVGKVSDKWSMYLDEWDRLFYSYRDQAINILEIGIQNGGSLEIWSKYFHKAEKIIGCDIDIRCANLKFDDDRISVVVGDANTDECKKNITSLAPMFDIILDDGSHKSRDVICSFGRYFSVLRENGIYVIEDLHSSYWQDFGGGLHQPLSAMAFLKRLADILNYEHWRNNESRVNLLTRFAEEYDVQFDALDLSRIHSIEFANSLCIIRKLSPDKNTLGLRNIVGEEEAVTAFAKKLNRTTIQDIVTNVSDDREFDVFELIKKTTFLGQNLSESNHTIYELNQQVAKSRQKEQELLIQVAEKEQRVQSLLGEVAEKEQRGQSLLDEVAKREHKVLALESQIGVLQLESSQFAEKLHQKEQNVDMLTLKIGQMENQSDALLARIDEYEKQVNFLDYQMREILISKAWKVAMFIRSARVLLIPPGSLRAKLARKILSFFSNLPSAVKRWQRRPDILLIRTSDFFDEDWYLLNNPDVKHSGMDAAYHYLCVGGFSGRDPGPNFSNQWYLDTYPDVKEMKINPLVHFLKFGQNQGRILQQNNISVHQNKYFDWNAILFISGCPGDAQRYRCVHQAEQFLFSGYSCDSAIYGEVDFSKVLNQYRCFILHRVPHGPDVEFFIINAKSLGKVVIFDTDDLVFDPDATDNIAALKVLSEDEKTLYYQGLVRYRKTLLMCDAVTVSTEQLKEEIASLGKMVSILPNVVSQEMIYFAEKALLKKEKLSRNDEIVIAYLSGTHTHNDDFLEAADAILWALEEYNNVCFHAVGYLDLDERFLVYKDRIRKTPLQPWQTLPEILIQADINLAPLQKNNRFTESKSCIKYLEAALVKIPTVASNRQDFRRVIRNGVNGFLADTDDEWKTSFKLLIESEDLRNKIGMNAYKQVMRKYTTISYASKLEKDFRNLILSTGYVRKERNA